MILGSENHPQHLVAEERISVASTSSFKLLVSSPYFLRKEMVQAFKGICSRRIGYSASLSS